MTRLHLKKIAPILAISWALAHAPPLHAGPFDFFKDIGEGIVDVGEAIADAVVFIGEGIAGAADDLRKDPLKTMGWVKDAGGILDDALGGTGIIKGAVEFGVSAVSVPAGFMQATIYRPLQTIVETGIDITANLIQGDIKGAFAAPSANFGEGIGNAITDIFDPIGSQLSLIGELTRIPLVSDMITGLGEGIKISGAMLGGAAEGFIATQGEVLASIVTDPRELIKPEAWGDLVAGVAEAQLETWKKQGEIIGRGAKYIGMAYIESGTIGFIKALAEGEDFEDALGHAAMGSLKVFSGTMEMVDRLFYETWENYSNIEGVIATSLTGDPELGERARESTAAALHTAAGLLPLAAEIAATILIPGVGGAIAAPLIGMIPTGAGEYDPLAPILGGLIDPIFQLIGLSEEPPEEYTGPLIAILDATGEPILLPFPDGILEAVIASGLIPIETTGRSFSITAKTGNLMIVALDSGESFHFLPKQLTQAGAITYNTLQKITHNPVTGSVAVTTSSGTTARNIEGAITGIFCFRKVTNALPPEAIEALGTRDAFEGVSCAEVIDLQEVQ